MSWFKLLPVFGKVLSKAKAIGTTILGRKIASGTVKGTAFDLATTVIPVGKVAKFIKPVVKATKWVGPKVFKSAKWVAPKVFSTMKSFIPKTKRSKIITGMAGIIGYGLLKESPIAREKVLDTAKDLPNLPGKLVDIGEDIGGAIEGDKPFGKDEVIDAAKTAGLTAGAIAAAAALALALKKAKDYRDREKPLEVAPAPAPEVAPVLTSPVVPTVTVPEDQLIKEKPLGIGGEVMTPETVSITPKKRKRRAPKKKTPSVRQSVRININNRPVGLRVTNKRYINNGLLA